MKGGNLRQIFLDCDGVLANMDEKLLSLFGIANAEDVLPEISWKGTLGHPPAEFANSKLVTTKKPRPDLSEVSDEQIFAEFWKRMGRLHDEHA